MLWPAVVVGVVAITELTSFVSSYEWLLLLLPLLQCGVGGWRDTRLYVSSVEVRFMDQGPCNDDAKMRREGRAAVKFFTQSQPLPAVAPVTLILILTLMAAAAAGTLMDVRVCIC